MRADTRNRIARVASKGMLALVCALFIAVVPACGPSAPGSDGSASSGKAEALDLPFGGGGGGGSGAGSGDEVSGASFAPPADAVVPEPSPDAGGEPRIDADNASSGYVIVQASSAAKLKFQVKLGEETYNYDLPNDGMQTIYPLNMGSGTYSMRIMQNTSGNNYVELSAMESDVSLDSEFAPFLIPNIFCTYTVSSKCVEKARELTAQADNVAQAVKDVCEFVAANVKYSNAKAEELSKTSGYVPNPDETLQTGEGICFDYASLSAAMLRSLGIPTKIMTGYVGADQVYHAWIMVYIDGTWHSAFFTVEPNTWSRCDVTFASTGATKYVGDASAYTDRFTY